MNTEQAYHGIGYRDALADFCMDIRMNGRDVAVKNAVERLLQIDPDQIHGKAVKKMLEDNAV